MTSYHFMMNKLFAFLLMMAACSPRISITSDFDPNVDFNSYRTFALAPMEEPYDPAFPMFDNEMNRQRIEDAIKREMRARGFTVNEEQPHVLVDYHIVIKDRTSIDSYHPQGKGFWQPHEVEIYQYTEGTIVIHLVDQNSDQLIWQGVGASLLRSTASNSEDRINKAIALIYEAYPATQ